MRNVSDRMFGECDDPRAAAVAALGDVAVVFGLLLSPSLISSHIGLFQDSMRMQPDKKNALEKQLPFTYPTFGRNLSSKSVFANNSDSRLRFVFLILVK